MHYLDKPCEGCGYLKKGYDVDSDAYYCINCQQWVESKCSDADCEFCNVRGLVVPHFEK